jgi:hypothetical protein
LAGSESRTYQGNLGLKEEKMEKWNELFGEENIDTVLNRIDESIEDGEYTDRLEAMIDEVEQKAVPREQVRDVAAAMLAYAEAEE